jgi:thioredoxin reductase (NADPH)
VKIVGYEADGGEFRGVRIEDAAGGNARTVAADGLFVAIGLIPENGPFADWAALDGRGYFASGEDCATKTPGVFVAGDCRAKAVRQVATAAADGATAALAAIRYLDSAE